MGKKNKKNQQKNLPVGMTAPDQSSSRPAQQSLGRGRGSPVPRPGQESLPRPGQESVPRPGQQSASRPGQESVSRPVQESLPRPGQESVPRPGQESASRPGQESVSRPVQESLPRPGQESVPRPGQQSAFRPGQESAVRPGPQSRGRGRGRGSTAPRPGQESVPTPEVRGAEGGDIEERMGSLSIAGSSPDDRKRVRQVSPDRLGFSAKQTKLIGNMPKKPGLNKFGRAVLLRTNLYPLKYPGGYVYHYDVEIMSVGRQSTTTRATRMDAAEKKFRCLNTKQNREVFQQMTRECPLFRGEVAAVYDGMKNAIMNRMLDITEPPFRCRVEVDDRLFEVLLQPAEKEDGGCAISLDLIKEAMKGRCPIPRESVAALEIILKHSACLRHIPIMQSFFSPPRYPVPLTNISEVWFGYHQSLRMASAGPVVNLNTSATVFYKEGPLLNFLMCVLDVNEVGLKRLVWDQHCQEQLNRRLRDLRVKTTHQVGYQRGRKISGFTLQTADQQKFQMDGNQVLVTDYFRDRYNITLKYRNLPCIIADNPAKNIFIPVEVCNVIAGQRCKDRDLWMPEKMIKATAEPPSKKFQEIFEIRERKTLFDQDRFLEKFGLKVDHNPLMAPGIRLEPPSVMYHNKSADPMIKPFNGSWNMKDKMFYDGASVRSWTLINFTRAREGDLKAFASALSHWARIEGMDMGVCQRIESKQPPPVQNKKALESFLEQLFQRYHRQVSLIVLVIPDKNNKLIYTLSKQAADKVGITLQCVQEHNVPPPRGKPGPSPSLICNILMKINAKMGGVNSIIRPDQMPKLMKEFMFMGADVTHPSPVGDIPCSIAAVVASVTPDLARYKVEIRTQSSDRGRQSREVIRDFQIMALNLLTAYREINGKLPKGIVVFRDGVSDGEVPIVQEEEVVALGKAIKSLTNDKVPIVYVVVQKRHNVRMMPENPRDADKRTGNPLAGTMTDTVITHPFLYDFFMYPHCGLQGTSKPIYCMVVRDDYNINPQDLHNMTFYLCHLYAPCTKSISGPAPIRYADKAAMVARDRLATLVVSSDSRTVNFAEMNHHLSVVDFKHVV